MRRSRARVGVLAWVRVRDRVRVELGWVDALSGYYDKKAQEHNKKSSLKTSMKQNTFGTLSGTICGTNLVKAPPIITSLSLIRHRKKNAENSDSIRSSGQKPN